MKHIYSIISIVSSYTIMYSIMDCYFSYLLKCANISESDVLLGNDLVSGNDIGDFSLRKYF